MNPTRPNPKQAGQGLPERLYFEPNRPTDTIYTRLPNGQCDDHVAYTSKAHREASAELVRRYNSHTELVAALRRAVDHLIMSGTKSTDAPGALEQARQALANATR